MINYSHKDFVRASFREKSQQYLDSLEKYIDNIAVKNSGEECNTTIEEELSIRGYKKDDSIPERENFDISSFLKNSMYSVYADEPFRKNDYVQDSSNSRTNENDNQKTYIDELRTLKTLLDDGIITQDEFDIKKKQILNI